MLRNEIGLNTDKQAMAACETAKIAVYDHFREVMKMVEFGSDQRKAGRNRADAIQAKASRGYIPLEAFLFLCTLKNYTPLFAENAVIQYSSRKNLKKFLKIFFT